MKRIGVVIVTLSLLSPPSIASAQPSFAFPDEPVAQSPKRPKQPSLPNYPIIGGPTKSPGVALPSAPTETQEMASPLPAPNQSPKQEIERDPRFERLHLKADMMAVALGLGATPEKLADLLKAQEALANAYCISPSLKTLNYRTPNTSPACLKHIKDVEATHKKSPVAICARKGFGDQHCRDAYGKQLLEGSNFSTASGSDLPDVSSKAFNEKNKSKIQGFESEISNIITMRSSLKEEEYLDKLDKIFDKLLPLTCRETRLRLTPLNLNFNSPPSANDQEQDSIEAFLPFEEKKSEEAVEREEKKEPVITKDTEFSRVRVVSYTCMSNINRAINIVKSQSSAICYKFGIYTPQCFEALRFARDKKKQAQEKKRQEIEAQRMKDQNGGTMPSAPIETKPKKLFDSF